MISIEGKKLQFVRLEEDTPVALREAGLSVQVAETYLSDFCEPNTQILRNLIDNITQNDLPYINGNIASTNEAIERARRG